MSVLPDLAWQVGPPPTHSAFSVVHLWDVGFALHGEWPEVLSSLLSTAERERAACFIKPTDRAMFSAVRGILRVVLGGYLDLAPVKLDIAADRYGRPRLQNTDIGTPLHFSVSHTDGAALIAVSPNPRIGVDIEAIRDDLPIIDIASRFFSPREAAELRALPVQDQLRCFYDWAICILRLESRNSSVQTA